MWRLLLNRRVWIGLAVVAGLLAVALWPRASVVDTGVVTRGPLLVTIDEEGETRVRHRFVVSAPVSGRLLRIELEPGDPVARERSVVARLLPDPPRLLDDRERADAQAAVDAAQHALGRARAEEQRARAARDLALTQLKREQELAAADLTTRQALDAREAEARTAEEAARAAQFSVAVASADLERARARLMPESLASGGRALPVLAPIDGVVLRRLRESEAIVPAGEPLVEVGDPGYLEIVSDLLSTDAVRVKPGMRVIVEQWGGARPLAARVRRVEPAGFTKVSALGVEEQRVNVVMDFVDARQAWEALGDAYRVEVRIVVWEGESVVKMPASALFRVGDRWAVYRVDAGQARLATLDLGQRNGEEAEVLAGAVEGQSVVLHPGDTLTDGARVTPRREPTP
jgi:HlyD family secretion protein